MKIISASVLVTLAVFFTAGCAGPAQPAPASPVAPSAAAPALGPSHFVIIGRVLAVEKERGFAFVDLTGRVPSSAVVADTRLITRRLDLTETGELAASSYARGHTLGARIVSGQPAPGDEVVLPRKP